MSLAPNPPPPKLPARFWQTVELPARVWQFEAAAGALLVVYRLSTKHLLPKLALWSCENLPINFYARTIDTLANSQNREPTIGNTFRTENPVLANPCGPQLGLATFGPVQWNMFANRVLQWGFAANAANFGAGFARFAPARARSLARHRVVVVVACRSAPPRPLRARTQSLKGVSGDVIILEEAAYCDPGLVAEVYAERAHPSARMRLTRRALRIQGRTTFEHAI